MADNVTAQLQRAIDGWRTAHATKGKDYEQLASRLGDTYGSIEKLFPHTNSPGQKAAQDAGAPKKATERRTGQELPSHKDSNEHRTGRMDVNKAKGRQYEDQSGQGSKGVPVDSSGEDEAKPDMKHSKETQRLGRDHKSDARNPENKDTPGKVQAKDPEGLLAAPSPGGQSTRDTDNAASVNDGRNPTQLATAPNTFEAASMKARQRIMAAKEARDKNSEPKYRP